MKALRQGGYVIVMRHASSPRQAPTKETAQADNVNLERELDQGGRSAATAMGKAFRELKIPVGDVLVSPTYRAIETVRYAEFSNPRTFVELGDGGQSMQGVTEAQGAWLQKKAAQFPVNTNSIIVTHLPNMARAFPGLTSGLADGEALIFGSDGKGGARLVARIKIDEWPKMRF